MKLYTPTSIDEFISEYILKGCEAINTDEGCLTSGDWILYDPSNKYKSYIIKEVFRNSWSSLQSCRAYNKLPKKYIKIIDEH